MKSLIKLLLLLISLNAWAEPTPDVTIQWNGPNNPSEGSGVGGGPPAGPGISPDQAQAFVQRLQAEAIAERNRQIQIRAQELILSQAPCANTSSFLGRIRISPETAAAWRAEAARFEALNRVPRPRVMGIFEKISRFFSFAQSAPAPAPTETLRGRPRERQQGFDYSQQRHRTPSPSLEPSYPELALSGAVGGIRAAAAEALEMAASVRTFMEGAEALAEAGAARYPTVRIPYGNGEAIQSLSEEALAARQYVEQGGTLYRTGTRGINRTGDDAQFWGIEHPATPEYVARYGMPPENAQQVDFIERATLNPGSEFITRPAPPSPDGTNGGGAIEVVIQNGERSILMESHSSLEGGLTQ